MPGPMVSQAKQQLKTIIDAYLTESDVERVLAACSYADIAHDGITRKSGEPIFTPHCGELYFSAYASRCRNPHGGTFT